MDLSELRAVFLLMMTSWASAITFPPSFIETPKPVIIYRPGTTVVLPCAASHVDTYKWRRNNHYFSWNRRVGRYSESPINGTVVIRGPTEADDGWYQCIAMNGYGTAYSPIVHLQRAYIRNFRNSNARTVEGVIGRSLVVTCKRPASYPKATVQWLYRLGGSGDFTPQQFVEESPRIAMDLNGNLMFSSVQREDEEKTFTCSASNRFLRFTVHGEDVRLKLHKAPNDQSRIRPIKILYRSPSSVYALANQTVRIRCFFEGYPTPRIQWRKDGMEGLPQGSRVLANGVELIFVRFQRYHVGTYRCRATNRIDPRGQTAAFTVRQEAKPRWIERPHDRLLPFNGSVEIKCDAEGIPPPTVEFTVNGKHVNHYLGKFKTIAHKKLKLQRLRKSDTAVIQCNASNIHGSIYVNAYINVLKDPPVFRRPPQKWLKIPEHKRAVLTCETWSAPPASVTWRKIGTPGFIVTQRHSHVPPQRVYMAKNGNLIIERTLMQDAATYRCIARNQFGMVQANGSLRVTSATRITTPLSSLIIVEGNKAQFNCTATTDPSEVIRLKIIWYKDSKPIIFKVTDRYNNGQAFNPRYKTFRRNSTFIISDARPSDSGVFTCMATNDLDEDWSNATLLVQGAPDAPRNLVADCRSRRLEEKAVLRWQPGPDNNAPITRYDVQFALLWKNDSSKRRQKMQWFAAEVVDNGPSSAPPPNMTLVRLRPWLKYTFRVTARNAVGASHPSNATRADCELPAKPPDKNPHNLRIASKKPGELAIYWTPMSPLDQNGPGLRYELRTNCVFCEGEDRNKVNKTIIRDWRRDHIVFRDLVMDGVSYPIRTYTKYRVTIRARNDKGPTFRSAASFVGYSGEDTPLATPTELSVTNDHNDPHKIRLVWSRPKELTEATVRGKFRGYRVRWCEVRMSDLQCDREMQYKDISVKPNSMGLHDEEIKEDANGHVFVTLKSLPGLVKLRIWVCVINTYFCGNASNKIEVQTEEGTPGPVSEFNMVSMGTTHLDFEWAKPLQINGLLTGYQLGIMKLDGIKDGDRTVKKFPPIDDREQLSDRIIGLLPNTNYRVYIWARTRKGNGKATHLDVRTANVNEQSKPKFRVHSVTGSSLNISLLPINFGLLPGPAGSDGKKEYEFYVEYQKLGSNTWEQTRTEYGPRRWMLLTGLDSDTTYYLRVVGGRNAIQSRSSDAVQVHTDELSGVESLFASGLIWLVVLGCAVLCLGVFLVGLCYFRHKRLKYARGKPLPTQESAEKAHEHNDYTMPMPEQITRLPGSGTLQRPMRDFTNHHDTLYMTKLGPPCPEDMNEMATLNGRGGNGYGYTSLAKSPVNTIPTSFV